MRTTRRQLRHRGRPGMVLIITMLVALGLSILGAILVDATRADTATAGSLRGARQAEFVAELGTMVSMRAFALNYSMYRSWMTRNRRFNFSFERASFDTGAAGAPRTLVDGTITTAGSIGYSDLRPDYDILVDRAYEYGDSAGYSVSGTQGVSFCFRRYTFTSAADLTIPAAGGPPGSLRSEARSVVRATSVVGPTDCTL